MTMLTTTMLTTTISKTISKTVSTKTVSTKTPIGHAGAIALVALLVSPLAWSHGSVTPQSVDIKDLERLGDEWREENPYRDHPQQELAIDIGARAYNSNCAACHGLEAKSGGIAPDLRELENGPWGDEWFKELVTNGAERNGRVLMPRMSDYVSQEGLWAIRTWLETVSIETTGQ